MPHAKPTRIPRCCLESFARTEIRENFKPVAPGDIRACDVCGLRYEMHIVWQPLARLHTEASQARPAD